MRIPAQATVTTMMVAFGLVFSGWAHGGETQTAAAVAFPIASVHFEQNATDRDVEVVFDVKGGDDGLVKLVVVSPDGRTVVDFKAPDTSTLGMRQFQFESPEPRDIASLKAAYPEGAYKFTGTSSSGAKLVGRSSLSHRLPPTASFIRPAPGAKNVAVKDLKISWSPVEGVASYILEIEQDELKAKIKAQLPASSTSFAVPNGFLSPGTEYTMGIGTVTREGNLSFVETSFTTKK